MNPTAPSALPDAISRQEAGPRSSAGTRLSMPLLVIAFVCTVALNAALLFREPGLGYDFLVFYGAALTLRQGFSPYDAFHRTHILQSLPLISRPDQHMVGDLYSYAPPFAWALSPFTRLSPAAAFVVWLVILLAATFGALMLLLRNCVPSIQPRLSMLLFALSPAPAFAYFLGQLAPMLLLGMALALALLVGVRRSSRYPWHIAVLAGALLSIVWIKPHLLLPLALVIIVLQPRRTAVALACGFSIGSGALLAVSLLAVGHDALGGWLHSLANFSQQAGTKSDIPALAGLYMPYLPSWGSTVLSSVLVLFWSVIVVRLVYSARQRVRTGGSDEWLAALGVAIAAWFLVVPYDHTADLTLVALIFPALLQGSRAWWSDLPTRLAASALVVAPELDLLTGLTQTVTLAYSICVPVALLVALRPLRLLQARAT